MSSDADTVREALEHMTYNGPVTRAAKAALARLEARAAQRDALANVVERIAEQQPETLAMIERNGFVFDSIGREPGNWQHLAFSIYTDLCEIDSLARAALAEAATREEQK